MWTCGPTAFGQAGKQAATVQALDNRASRSVDDFSKEAFEIAKEYESAGQYEKAKKLLQTILVVRPELQGLKEKIKELHDSIITRNEFEMDYTPTDDWKGPVGRVAKGQKFRVQASGTYRLSANLGVTPEGFPTDKPLQGSMVNAPFGSLLGVVVPFDKKQADDAKPFVVGSGQDHAAQFDGALFLKVNVPRGSKCTGELTVTLSGAIARN
jgi:hypothetical protein